MQTTLFTPRFVSKSGLGVRGGVILEADWCVDEIMKKNTRNSLRQKYIGDIIKR